jgi:hypothetical protein
VQDGPAGARTAVRHIGDLETHDDHARLLCRDVDAVVVSVDCAAAVAELSADLKDLLSAG